ncbi:MAG: primosomal protein N' [bacterium]
MIAEIAFPVPLFRTFHYKVPSSLLPGLQPGMRVTAQLGWRRLTGIVISVAETSPGIPPEKLKDLEKVLDPYPLYGAELMELAGWIAARWSTPVGQVLSALMPSAACTPQQESAASLPAQSLPETAGRFELSLSQKAALETLIPMLHSGTHGRQLLFGASVTGKTEIYIRLIREVLKGEGQAVFLIPDIALTEPFLDEILASFAHALTVCWHSRMTVSARKKAWAGVACGSKRLILGTRSACLLPFKKLRLAVVDEEQDESYKQEESEPYYHARDVLAWRTRRHNALLLLGSATPSLETYRAASAGETGLIRMTDRVLSVKEFPKVTMVDRKTEPKKLISDELALRLKTILEQGEQAILLINRRGYSLSYSCLNCGWFVRCPACSAGMALHRGSEKAEEFLLCHRCGKKNILPEKCPRCADRIFKQPGAGTQKVEQEIRKLFTGIRAVRLDADSSRKVSGEGRRAYRRFAEGDADILIGTRCVSRGYHFPRVTLVGVLDADTELHTPDFRAAERTVQMLCQAGGRAGRAEKPGELLVQTFEPDNYAFSCLSGGDYEKFANKELDIRKQLGYPPFRKLLRCVVSSRNEKTAVSACETLSDILENLFGASGTPVSGQGELLGPAPCQIGKSRGMFRHHVIIKAATWKGIEACSAAIKSAKLPKGVRIKTLVDPCDFR